MNILFNAAVENKKIRKFIFNTMDQNNWRSKMTLDMNLSFVEKENIDSVLESWENFYADLYAKNNLFENLIEQQKTKLLKFVNNFNESIDAFFLHLLKEIIKCPIKKTDKNQEQMIIYSRYEKYFKNHISVTKDVATNINLAELNKKYIEILKLVFENAKNDHKREMKTICFKIDLIINNYDLK